MPRDVGRPQQNRTCDGTGPHSDPDTPCAGPRGTLELQDLNGSRAMIRPFCWSDLRRQDGTTAAAAKHSASPASSATVIA